MTGLNPSSTGICWFPESFWITAWHIDKENPDTGGLHHYAQQMTRAQSFRHMTFLSVITGFQLEVLHILIPLFMQHIRDR